MPNFTIFAPGFVFDSQLDNCRVTFSGYDPAQFATSYGAVQDGNGKYLAILQGISSGEPVHSPPLGRIQGLQVPATIPGGAANLAAFNGTPVLLVFYD